MLKQVKKIENGLKGEITIPSDKSVSHRAIMFSSISEGECIIKNFSSGADCHSTLNLFKELGVNISFIDEKTVKVKSTGILTPSASSVYDCGNSGTTMRLVSGILAGQKFNSTLIGDESLSKRTMKRIIDPLSLMGADIKSTEGHAPLTICGKNLHGIDYSSPLASAQVKSSVLLAGLYAEGATSYKEIYPSRNHTEIMLKYLGADIEQVNETTVKTAPSKLTAKDITVVGDISSASFFIVAGLIVKGSDFVIRNVGLNSTRTGIIDVVRRMGGNIEILNKKIEAGEEVGDIRVIYTDNLKACEISGEDIPRLIDELPVIAVLASQAEGETVVKNAEDLRNKESDRISALTNELKKIGADITETPDGFIVRGKKEISGNAELNSYHDHRLAMSFYIAGLISKQEIAIEGFEWTKISFPEFEQLINKLN